MEEVIKAAALYKAALKENRAELMVPLEDCKVYYIPSMPHCHREIWLAEDLIIFHATKEETDDHLQVSPLQNGLQRNVYFCAIDNYDDMEHHVIQVACYNMRQTFSRSLLPRYYYIDSILMLRMTSLLAFV